MIFKNLFTLIAITCHYVMAVKGAAYTGPITTEGLNLIKSFEHFAPNPMLDPIGHPTVGYGHWCQNKHCSDVVFRFPLNTNTATDLLKMDLIIFGNCINSMVKYSKLNAAQFSALSSLVYNVGCVVFHKSALLQKLNKNDVRGAADEFAKLNTQGGKVVVSLTKRREAERKLFCSNVC